MLTPYRKNAPAFIIVCAATFVCLASLAINNQIVSPAVPLGIFAIVAVTFVGITLHRRHKNKKEKKLRARSDYTPSRETVREHIERTQASPTPSTAPAKQDRYGRWFTES